jgi:cytochrome c biogenesis protein
MSATRSKVGAVFAFLASLRFAVLLLALIAFGSIFGTIIKQRGGADEYVALYSKGTYRLISSLGLDDVYHAPWFYALILLFGLNLTLCTIQRLKRFKALEAERKVPTEQALAAMEMSFVVNNRSLEEVSGILEKTYRPLCRDNDGEVLERGRLARYGVYIIHSSVILILLGSFIGLVAGYRGFVVLSKGEVRDHMTLRGREPREVPLGFTLKCKDFKVSFYPGGEPKDYVSTLEVIDQGRPVMEREVRVNSPLAYRGFRVYQASYGSTPSFVFDMGGEKVVMRESEIFNKGDLAVMAVRFVKNVHNFGPGVLLAYIERGETKAQWFLTKVEKMREFTIMGVKVRIDDITEEPFTGLEVSRDPGVWVVWTGFALILVGLYVNFFLYYRRIYARKTPEGVIVSGIAPKNREAFREEFKKLEGRLNGLGS